MRKSIRILSLWDDHKKVVRDLGFLIPRPLSLSKRVLFFLFVLRRIYEKVEDIDGAVLMGSIVASCNYFLIAFVALDRPERDMQRYIVNLIRSFAAG